MGNVRHLLVAVDRGDSSTPALSEAKEIAARLGARLHLLSVVQDPSALPWAPDASTEMLVALLDGMQRDASAHLDRVMPPVDRERLQAEVVVRVGRRPSTEILTYAAEQNIDLIVLGKNGSPEGSAEAGSVVEAVVRGSRCPVLVVPAGTALSHRGRA